MDTLSLITAIASSVSALGIVFVGVHAWLLYRQTVRDHERSRREMTVRLIQHWNRSLSPLNAAARCVVAKLDDEQCRKLLAMQPVSLSADHQPMLETCLAEIIPTDPLTRVADLVTLTPKQVTRLRYLVTDYMNETEAVLLAWSLSIADRSVIEHEFGFLWDVKGGEDALAKFRDASGGTAVYPATGDFIHKLRAKQEQTKKSGKLDQPPL